MQLIIGKKSVYEALRSNQFLDRIVIDYRIKNDVEIKDICSIAKKTRVKFQFVSSKIFKTYSDHPQSQGVIAYVQEKKSGDSINIIFSHHITIYFYIKNTPRMKKVFHFINTQFE